jgi:hypothetical protein
VTLEFNNERNVVKKQNKTKRNIEIKGVGKKEENTH